MSHPWKSATARAAAAVPMLVILSSPRARADNSMFVPVTPCRIVDTRAATPAGPVIGGTTRAFDVVGLSSYSNQGGASVSCGIPGFVAGHSIVTAVAMNIIAVTPSAQGNLLAYPTDTTPATTSTLNYPGPGVPLNVANGVIIPVRQDGPGNDVAIRTSQTTHVVIDVTGYFTPLPIGADFRSPSTPGMVSGVGNVLDGLGYVGSTIAGGAGNAVHNTYGTVSGGSSNEASIFATVGGGSGNHALGESTVVAGGSGNSADGIGDTVGGGSGNQASNGVSTVGGGYGNQATGGRATVGGGYGNYANGFESVISGGFNNEATGDGATVPGGKNNEASGDFSFAAGRRAKANANGSFTWADSTNKDFVSTSPDTFRVRATGGVRFVTAINDDGTAAKSCFINGSADLSCDGTINVSSDRRVKTDVAPVDVGRILAHVAEMPIASWSYRADRRHVRHVGPMAQDFHAAFRVGADDRHIATVDADGIALAAIQALNAKVARRDDEIAALKELVRSQSERIAALERAMPRNVADARP